MRLCNEYKVRPSEIWNTGSIGTNPAGEKGLLKPPYFTTLFFDWRAGSGRQSSRNISTAAVTCLPDGDQRQHHGQRRSARSSRQQLPTAITCGVGTEDNPYNRRQDRPDA